jgi:anthranilate synthase component 2
MIALIDNYDSFTFNLLHYLEEFESGIKVFRNDEVSIEQLEEFSHIVISPGPGLPSEIEFLTKIFTAYSEKKNILGVCLGMQALVEFSEGKLYNLPEVLHGRQGQCLIVEKDPIFNEIESPFLIGHYHSWGVSDDGIPKDLKILARDSENRIMLVKHRVNASYGIQFHPESILCPIGKKLLFNWLKETGSTTK